MYENLLYESESATLDFKSEQYRFIGEENKHIKSELLKDILAFTNAWRRETAYILIGIKESKDRGTAEVVGITSSLDDAQLQQFVNDKTQRPVEFIYKEVTMQAKKVGVIEIPSQKRPVYLKKRYGSLEKDTVYLRRGSSTAVANPDEVSEMGKLVPETPSLDTSLIKFSQKALPRNILDHIQLGTSLESVKEYLSAPQSKGKFMWSVYSTENITTTVWNYEFSNAKLCLEADHGESISVITLQTYGEPDNLFDLPVVGNLGEITMGEVMDELQFDSQTDKFSHFRSMRDGYILLECYFGRLGGYKHYTLGNYDGFEVFKYDLRDNQFFDKDGNLFDGRSIKINFISIAREEKRGHYI